MGHQTEYVRSEFGNLYVPYPYGFRVLVVLIKNKFLNINFEKYFVVNKFEGIAIQEKVSTIRFKVKFVLQSLVLAVFYSNSFDFKLSKNILILSR